MHISVKDAELRAAKHLEELLAQVPPLKLKTLKVGSLVGDSEIDLMASVDVSGQPHFLICEVKLNGQPRYVRDGIHKLRDYIAHFGKPATPVLIAPYLSPASRELCLKDGVSYLDFEGNARLAFNSVFIERLISNKPASERREFKSLFKPKSAQVLRILLRDPKQIWRVTDLAEAAAVSVGHVSNVRTALLDHEWAQVLPKGLQLTAPDALLDAWKLSYQVPIGEQLRFYTTAHGSMFEKFVREIFSSMSSETRAALASFSAAQWIAPYARTGTHFFYADECGLQQIKDGLQLSSTLKGENVIVSLPRDQGVFTDSYQPVPGVRCTSPVQTYLDLSKAGERGEEAADHLRRTKLIWQN